MSKQAAAYREADGDFTHPAQEAAFSLVNPLTGLANDYLNVFNEMLLLMEFLPTMPEMTEEALAWRPRGYREYFRQSPLPGAREALRAYEEIDPERRVQFESSLARLTRIAERAQKKVAEGALRPNYPESIVKSCEMTAVAMRAALAMVAQQINEGCPEKTRVADAARPHKNGI